MVDFSVGERIMIFRRRAGLSKAELAERAGVSVSTITNYESDKVKEYDADILADLSIALGITVNELLLGIKDPNTLSKLKGLIQN